MCGQAIIESGAMEESSRDRAMRAAKADAALAAKEEQARLERFEAKKRKAAASPAPAGEANGSDGAAKKRGKAKKKGAVLSFDADDPDE